MILLVLINIVFSMLLLFNLTDANRKIEDATKRLDMLNEDVDVQSVKILDLYGIAQIPPMPDEEAASRIFTGVRR
ncbi:hypothetical protein ACQXZL_09655 [Corynebacterium diphtheriae]|uniref:Uncharacterized protein n=2 Tax=Corynebacterium TaxID=1716 RepID=A0A811G0C5_CORDP|nr:MULTISPECIES: hypothetical protein [Corynebacterium]AEX71155.1 hypothetical protein CDCE8392_0151 [Corynebacterium diphtheriae CDCE 8392]EIK57170.1 hypothetical protein W5M_00753 [Corynebacterium diphtheriae bv. intermedius str. NCTC 5011]OWM36450.1 hypothetical protein AZF07_09995 [Corynebacterium diphtheriae subsp. lausannense]OWM37401.1 hypothetical protein AZF05_04450 [Corynebacterium diphtheriae bv. intermedius]AEX66353.1 hypothetical protein CDC7B_0152 [Corynebacterium diphtheriae C7 